MAEVYAAARNGDSAGNPAGLEEQQRDWIESRDACEKSAEPPECLQESYRRRIAELQARHALVPLSGTFTYTCDDDRNKIVHARFYETDPLSLYAEYDEQDSVMIVQPSSTGVKYAGQNETTLWEHGDEALITWGYERPVMKCLKTPLIAPPAPNPGASRTTRSARCRATTSGSARSARSDRAATWGRVSFQSFGAFRVNSACVATVGTSNPAGEKRP
ncbi:MliC family protein [Azotobacter vinelandii]